MSDLKSLSEEIINTLEEKEKAYGRAFDKVSDFLLLLYPNGVKPEQYKDMLFTVRIFDKLMRIANNKNAFGESPYKDMTGYSFLGWRNAENTKKIEEHKANGSSFVPPFVYNKNSQKDSFSNESNDDFSDLNVTIK